MKRMMMLSTHDIRVAGDQPQDRAEDDADGDGEEADEQGDVRPFDHPGEHVTPVLVCPKPVRAAWSLERVQRSNTQRIIRLDLARE